MTGLAERVDPAAVSLVVGGKVRDRDETFWLCAVSTARGNVKGGSQSYTSCCKVTELLLIRDLVSLTKIRREAVDHSSATQKLRLERGIEGILDQSLLVTLPARSRMRSEKMDKVTKAARAKGRRFPNALYLPSRCLETRRVATVLISKFRIAAAYN